MNRVYMYTGTHDIYVTCTCYGTSYIHVHHSCMYLYTVRKIGGESGTCICHVYSGSTCVLHVGTCMYMYVCMYVCMYVYVPCTTQ